MKLIKFTVNSGGKFSPDAPVVIDFSKSNYVVASGDKGEGKSTLLELFLMACGAISGEKITDKLKNKDTDKIDLDFSFVGKDRLSYDVKVTKSVFKLLYEGSSLPSPLTKIKELLGVVGVNPSSIKDKPLKDIIKWLAAYSNKNPEEVEKRLEKIKDGIKESQRSRASANNSAKGLREYLSGEGLVDKDGQIIEKKWNELAEQNKTPVKVDEISARLKTAGDKSDKFIQNETKLKAQKERKSQVEEQIKTLQAELTLLDKAIVIGDKWIADNKTVKKDYDNIKEEYDNSAKKAIAYNKWQDIKSKKKELDEFEDLATKADSKEKGFIQERKDLQIEILPDLKGLEIVSEDTHENGKLKKEGLYRYGISSVQMSGTEWMEIFLEMFKKNKGKILVVDNASDLGSSFMELLEKLRAAGCYILIAEMNREQKSLEIEYQ